MPVRGGWRGPWLGAQVLLGVLACDGPTQPAVVSLTVEPAAATLDLGFTRRFAAVARGQAGETFRPVGVVWESSDTTVVAISADSGLVTARAPGTAVVRATVQGMTAAAEIEVPRLTFASVSVGDRQICGVTTTDLAYCWGANMSGQLGNGDTTGELRVLPEPVVGGLHFKVISTEVPTAITRAASRTPAQRIAGVGTRWAS